MTQISDLLDLTDQVVLVTGASGNIGAGIARKLHLAGASVALHSASNLEAVRALASELGTRVVVLQGDVERDAERLCAETITAFGQLTAVVNNAGIQPVQALLEQSNADRTEMLRVNTLGVMAMTASAARVMLGGGSIVNIASIEGLQPALNHSHYTTSKAAVLMHTRNAALELGQYGIRVNSVSPGLINREGLREAWAEGVQRWEAACPLGRLGEVDDVANAVLFLLSSAARFISGTNLIVDGGTLTNNVW